MSWLTRQQQLVRDAPRSKWFVVAAGLVPLVGVLAGWELGIVMAAFWMENAVVGLFSMIRMAIVARWMALFLVPFFSFHFGMFTAVHGIFVFGLFFAPEGFSNDASQALAAIRVPLLLVGFTLLLSHGASFVQNFILNGRWRQAAEPQAEMGRAYKRLFVLHVVLVLGAFPVLALGQPIWALGMLVALKILVDVWGHSKEHGKPLQADAPVATA